MPKVKVAIIGVGNCASALVQGVYYYKDADENEFVPGLMHVRLGPYHVGDIEFVAAFDIDKNKVGKDLSEAIFAPPNCTMKFADVPRLGVEVMRGMTHDSLGKYLQGVIEKHPSPTVDVADVLKSAGADVVVNFLPVGSESATKWYVEQVLDAGAAFVNGIPVFIAREPRWQEIFEKRGVPLIGDDVKSQVGATILHRVLIKLLVDRGVKIERTYQLNFGGNTDFLSLTEPERNLAKEETKSGFLEDVLGYEPPHFIRPTGYLEPLGDRKFVAMHIQWVSFGGFVDELVVNMRINDSPALAGYLVDLARLAYASLRAGVYGTVPEINLFYMKRPGPLGTRHKAKILAYRDLLSFVERLREMRGLPAREAVTRARASSP